MTTDNKAIVQLTETNNYGTKVYYPYNKFAKVICECTQTKTMTRHVVNTLVKAGFTVQVVVENYQTKEVTVLWTIQ